MLSTPPCYNVYALKVVNGYDPAMSQPLEDLVARVQKALLSGPPMRLAVLFGSQVRGGRPHSDSDLDLAIEPVDPSLSLKDELSLQAAVARAVGCEVDLVRLDKVSPLVRYEVARHGRSLLPGTESAFRRFQALAALEYADMAPLLAVAARRFRRALVTAPNKARDP